MNEGKVFLNYMLETSGPFIVGTLVFVVIIALGALWEVIEGDLEHNKRK